MDFELRFTDKEITAWGGMAIMKRMLSLGIEAFLYDGNQDVNGDGNPDLRLDCILGGSVKPLDPEMLFDPLEE